MTKRRIDLLRRHDREDKRRMTRAVGLCDPQIIEREGGEWSLHHTDYPPVDKAWFVCAPSGKPFPHSCGYTKAKAITGFLALLNLPERPATRTAGFCLHYQQPERGKWWAWFKHQGYTAQKFEVNPQDPPRTEIMNTLRYELRSAHRQNKRCIWCNGAERFQNIARRLSVLIDAIDYYSARPEEQRRWLETMNELWLARKTGQRG